jgi:hypothetical protein
MIRFMVGNWITIYNKSFKRTFDYKSVMQNGSNYLDKL